MNKKRRWRISQLLSGALAILGFAGCSNSNEPDDIPCLYGSPTVDFRVIGKVTDQQGNPLENIQVILDGEQILNYVDEEGNPCTQRDSLTGAAYPDTVYTNKDGDFATHHAYGISTKGMTVTLRDIDGEANGGEFHQEILTESMFEKKEIKEGDFWYAGDWEFSKEVQLKRKGE